MELDQGHGVKIVCPDEPFKPLADILLILWKMEFDPSDILLFCENTLEDLEGTVI